MGTHYEQLSAEERATMMLMAHEGKSLRAMARTLHRAPSTISREWRRHSPLADASGTRGYDAKQAGQDARRCRFKPRRSPKLAVEGVLFGVVEQFLPEGWSPGQIAGAMKMMWPDAPERRV
jgi:IS30 family transposase